MTLPDDRDPRTPRDRFRNILSAEKEAQGNPEPRKPTVVNLPKVGATAQDEVGEVEAGAPAVHGAAAGARAGSLLPRFWTIGAILSVVANLLLMILLISRWTGLGVPGSAGTNASALLGAYTSLEQMDNAHIKATIPIKTSILLDASVPVETSTNLTLDRDVSIQGAHVTINTALFNIDAPANITLPAGTTLDVDLDMDLPLETSVPISVDLPVDIVVADTDLHTAIQSMQDSLRPILCATLPGAMLPDGTPICR